MSAAGSGCFGREEIQQLIPHRPPFLWIDEVVEFSDTKLVARKHLSADLDVFRGHYPQFPVLPGVLLCEAAFQAAAILIARSAPPEPGQVPVVTRIQNVQFRRLVRPGETITLEVEITERLARAYFLKGKVLVDSQVAARLEFACTVTDEPKA
ncbi:MAG: 3-hydroxyacyl-ACP dehydratase FabZ [Planctomycetaceae bacterium]